jgi:hypothetical protein
VCIEDAADGSARAPVHVLIGNGGFGARARALGACARECVRARAVLTLPIHSAHTLD